MARALLTMVTTLKVVKYARGKVLLSKFMNESFQIEPVLLFATLFCCFLLIYLIYILFRYINQKRKRYYFVSYKYYTANGFKFGNVFLIEFGPLFCVTKAQKQILNQVGTNVVVIDNFIKITKKEFLKNGEYGEFI